CLQGKTSPFTF
nr:immunoglobulin light chain junction region [Macaca mulatta]MOV37657.1 immunoglobulin light chain junction region [Macaca mulatta]